MSVNLQNKFVAHMDAANRIFAWQVLDNLTVPEAEAAAAIIVDTVESHARTGKVKLLVDNRFMERNGRAIVFTPDVNAIWEDAQRKVFPHVSHVAVLCSGTLMKMQMDRISRNSNLSEVNKSFWNEDDAVMLNEAFAYLGVKDNEIVKAK